MTRSAEVQVEPILDGLEEAVWVRILARRQAASAASSGVRFALTIAALAVGVAAGGLRPAERPAPDRPAHLSELTVLSEDGLLVPSMILGGGA